MCPVMRGRKTGSTGMVVNGTARGEQVEAHAQVEVLAEEVRRRRKKQGLSLEQLAAASGVSRSMISKIERAEAVPSPTVLSRLAEARC